MVPANQLSQRSRRNGRRDRFGAPTTGNTGRADEAVSKGVDEDNDDIGCSQGVEGSKSDEVDLYTGRQMISFSPVFQRTAGNGEHRKRTRKGRDETKAKRCELGKKFRRVAEW